ncbi:MAG: malate synthase A [Maricaulaceae bacterium]
MNERSLPQGVRVRGPLQPGYDTILTPEALAFIADLERRFGPRRRALLEARQARQARLDQGERPDFPAETAKIRAEDWTVRPAPEDLRDRRVEITGPVDRKMVINALNSGASCFMADFEDASSPSWANMVEGQINLRDAVNRTIRFEDPKSGKAYALNDDPAVLIVRARGWHLEEAHVEIDGQPMSAGLFDFGLYLFHNHAALKANATGPYFYLPKLEGAAEAALWGEVFAAAEDALGLDRGTARATLLIETILASFELDEILHAMRDHIVGLNCGRWDYIFSYIKRFKADPEKVLPDRAQVTMTTPFMRAYAQRVIAVCHRRGAHAMGGMSAFIPIKGDDRANAQAFEKLTLDKVREAHDGHDGTWVAHPGMVEAARAVFDAVMPDQNQLTKQSAAEQTAAQLLAPCPGAITQEGVDTNVDVGVRYIAAWLRGQGAVPLHNLMEDAATAEISRAQLWQWRTHAARTSDGSVIDTDRLEAAFADCAARLRDEVGSEGYHRLKYADAVEIMRELVFADDFAEFLTLPAYERIKTLVD